MTATERSALTNALTAASAGPNPPPIDRLRAAAEYVIARAKPDQLILFGSASRGEFRADSDFDFFVVRNPAPGTRATNAERWTHPETKDEIDVLFETAELAEKYRWLLGTPEAVIFADGSTVHQAPGSTPVSTLRDSGRTVGDMTRPKYKWDPSEAQTMIKEAGTYLRLADTAAAEESWGVACKELQESAERSLKGVIIATDTEFKGVHDLGNLWTTACDADSELPLKRDNKHLTKISEYSGRAGYSDRFRPDDPEELFQAFRPTAGKLLDHAEKRVNLRLAEREEAPVRPSAAPAAETIGETARTPKTPSRGGGGDR